MVDELAQFAAEIKDRAQALGFDRVGIAPARPSAYRDYFRRWLDDGNAATMPYLANRFDERTDPTVYLPGAQSVICLAMNYFVPLADSPSPCTQGEGRGEGSSNIPEISGKSKMHPHPNPLPEYMERGPEGTGRIARYALGDDYHEIIKPRLHKLADWIKERFPQAQTRAAVDTAPVMEKELAARAGIGWMGKNTCLINEEIGSWLFLGEVLTTLPLPADEAATDRCGTCTRCIDACPTGAITAPYQLDARRCISYLTIEHRGDIAEDLAAKMGDWIYGCDICQDVCPWNRRAAATLEPRLQSRFPGGTIALDKLEGWTAEDYQGRLRGSAMKRVKLPVLKRNGRIARRVETSGISVKPT
ncbi:MAG: tRNA epoxyqueuosine(34) reductase QueG [Tepidisphaeraceae bacterium]|jgi:epoxyqueuosine reductase